MDVTEPQDRFKRVEPDDPRRCQGTRTSGQCNFEAVKLPDGTYGKLCALHDAGSHQGKAYKKRALNLYQLTKYGGRVEKMLEAGSHDVFLDEELAVLRMTLETCLEKYSEVELVTNSGHVASLVGSISQALTVNKKLQSQMGQLMDRAAINRLCDKLVSIIADYAPEDKVDEVAGRVAGAVGESIAERMEVKDA